jgi:alkylation response protein AidB-like acyl-CoA dehydrogenase
MTREATVELMNPTLRRRCCMYDLRLTAEQLEIRDTVRDFVEAEIKPVLLNASRLDRADRTLPPELLDRASQMGLRTLALSEDRGGVGADSLTACIVTEELAAGDADLAAALAETSRLAHLLFDRAMIDAQRERFLDGFLADDRFHLALAEHEPGADRRLGVSYHRPVAVDGSMRTAAVRSGGDWIVSGVKDCVANAPIAQLFVVAVAAGGTRHLLIPRDTPGLAVHAEERAWRHGPCGAVEFDDCRVPADNLLGEDAAALFGGSDPQAAALNLGIGRAAYDAAVAYAQLRVQGGRPIIEHQAIGAKLADIAIKLELARAAIRQAAWALDHPEAVADRSLSNLPLATIAQVFTAEAMLTATKDAAEVFGAMGVMRDMPLPKYVTDARIALHRAETADAKLRIAEALAGYRRPVPAAVAAAE